MAPITTTPPASSDLSVKIEVPVITGPVVIDIPKKTKDDRAPPAEKSSGWKVLGNLFSSIFSSIGRWFLSIFS
jgi:hypothetical protein